MFTRFDFTTATPESLADHLGEVKARAATLADEIKKTEAAILACDTNNASGKRYAFTVVDATQRESFKPAKAKALLSAAQIMACTELVDVKASVRLRAKS